MKNGHGSSPGEGMRYISVGLQLAVTVLIFVYGGYYLDSVKGSSPLFVAVGAFVGVVLGFYNLLKRLLPPKKSSGDVREDLDKDRTKWL